MVNTHIALVARKENQIIAKSFLNDYNEDAEYNDEEDLVPMFIQRKWIGEEEKQAFKKWYEDADWYGYDNEESAMRNLNKHGDFKEHVFPSEMVGVFGNIDISIEEVA